MSDKRQKNQLVLAFTEEGRSEAPKASQEGTESHTAECETERPASHEQLMEEVCKRENCWQAYKRVKANKGSPGIDGMTVGDLSDYLKQHWPSIREQLLRGTYQPLQGALPIAYFDALSLPRLFAGLAQPTEPPYADPHLRWCGRGGRVTVPLCRFRGLFVGDLLRNDGRLPRGIAE
jgi:hypothetical protein